MENLLFENTVRQKLNALTKEKKKEFLDLATAYYKDILTHIPANKKQDMIDWTALQFSQTDKNTVKDKLETLLAFFNAKYTTINFRNPGLTFEELERQNDTWHNELAKSTGMGSRGALGKPIIKFPDGWAWVDLDKGFCKIEGQAMGHCGNAQPKSGDNIYSLRDPRNVPYLTFIVNKKSLGEMKGRSNNKPEIKFHPYIMALLKSPYVEKIHGGGYAPQNNFKIGDLSIKDYTELHQLKPNLLPSLKQYLEENKYLNPRVDERLVDDEPEYFQSLALSMLLDKQIDKKGNPISPEATAVVNHIKKIRPMSFALVTNDTDAIKNGIHELIDQSIQRKFYDRSNILVNQAVMLKKNNSDLFDYFVNVAKKRNTHLLGDVVAQLYINKIKVSDDLLSYLGIGNLNDILAIHKANDEPVPEIIQKLVGRARLYGDYSRHRLDRYKLTDVLQAYIKKEIKKYSYPEKEKEDPDIIEIDRNVPDDFDYDQYFKLNSIIPWDEVKRILHEDLNPDSRIEFQGLNRPASYMARSSTIVELLAHLINSKDYQESKFDVDDPALLSDFAKYIKTDNKLFWQRLYTTAKLSKNENAVKLISKKLGHEFLPQHMRVTPTEAEISQIDFADASPKEILNKFNNMEPQAYLRDSRYAYKEDYLKPIWSKLTRQQIKDTIYKKFPAESMFIKTLTSFMTNALSVEEFPGYFNDLYFAYDINSQKESGNIVRNLQYDRKNQYLNWLYAYDMFYRVAPSHGINTYQIAHTLFPKAVQSTSKKSLDYLQNSIEALEMNNWFLDARDKFKIQYNDSVKLNMLFLIKNKNIKELIFGNMGYPVINLYNDFFHIPHAYPPFFKEGDFDAISNLAQKMNQNPYSLIKKLMQDILDFGRLIPYSIAKFFNLEDKWKEIYNNLSDKDKEQAKRTIDAYEKLMNNPDTAKTFNDKKQELESFKEWFNIQWNKDFGL